MNNFWLKTKIWTKLIVILGAITYIILFSAYNGGFQASVWLFFGEGAKKVDTSVMHVVLIAFGAGVLATILARTTFRTVSQIRELRTREAALQRDREIEALKAKAGMLRVKRDVESTEEPVAKSD